MKANVTENEITETEILQQTLDKQAQEKEWLKNFVRNTDFETLD